jgi:hypothetical protein
MFNLFYIVYIQTWISENIFWFRFMKAWNSNRVRGFVSMSSNTFPMIALKSESTRLPRTSSPVMRTSLVLLKSV